MTLWLDIETKSRTNLRDSGVHRYTEDPEFEILMCGWSHDGVNVQVSLSGDIAHIPGLLDPRVPIVAHNAAFERTCLIAAYGNCFPPERFIDTMALAGEHGYPQKLAPLAKALKCSPKDSAGTLLINTFCKPNRKGGFTQPEEKPEKWQQFIDYCAQDVATLIEVHAKLPDWPTETERRLWTVDQLINDRGLPIDVEMMHAAREAGAANHEILMDEARAITGLDNPNSVTQLQPWFTDQGVDLPNLQAATVTDALAHALMTDAQHRVLEIRQETAGSAYKKFTSATASVCADGRLRGSFQFCGAHTGRWSGRRVQPQNLPSEAFKDADGEHDATAEMAAIVDLLLGFGADPLTLKRLVRALFTGPFTVVDYAAIEARVLAWMAGEAWRLKAFEEGRDIYVESANRMGKYTRKQGKVAELALGYQGAVGALRRMGATGTDAELTAIKVKWRRASPAIVRFWYDLQRAFWAGGTVGPLRVEVRGSDRLIHLPSGRTLTYHDVRRRGDRLTYREPSKGFRNDTYGGALTENVTQAVARDILAAALLALDERSIPVIGHVHDEVIIEGEHPVDEIVKIMCDLPAWADGLPMAAKGFITMRYRKD